MNRNLLTGSAIFGKPAGEVCSDFPVRLQNSAFKPVTFFEFHSNPLSIGRGAWIILSIEIGMIITIDSIIISLIISG